SNSLSEIYSRLVFFQKISSLLVFLISIKSKILWYAIEITKYAANALKTKSMIEFALLILFRSTFERIVIPISINPARTSRNKFDNKLLTFVVYRSERFFRSFNKSL